MKRTGKVLVSLLLLCIAGFIGFRCVWRQSVVSSSTSPDGKWRCIITDIDPSPYQVTLIYCVQAVGSPFPLSGTQYISYEDSAVPGDVSFEWSQERLFVRDYRRTLAAEFGPGWQRWREESESHASKP